MMCARNRHAFRDLLLIATAVAVWLPARPAHAAAYTYSARQRTINAGILMADDKDTSGMTISGMGEGFPTSTAGQIAVGADNPDPYVFYVLNQRSDIKPLGWNIVNPLAPPTVTGDIQARWDARAGIAAGSGNHAYALTQAITPNMAPYWEVSLSRTGLDDLLQFDVLLLNLQGHTVRLTMSETEKLRRFVDGGGQLWVEDSGGGNIANDPTNNLFYGPLFFDAQFDNGAAAGQAALPPAAGLPILLRHPIIDTPNLLSNNELNSLGIGLHIKSTIVGAAGTTSLPDQSLLTTVVGNSNATNLPVIAAGQLGAGQVVVTTTGSSAAINDAVGGTNPVGFGANSGPISGNNFAAVPVADLKFVSDILSWDTAHPTEHKTSHQSSQSRSNLGPAVTPVWNYPDTAAAAGPTFTPGAALNGDYVYVRGVDGLLHAFNAEPGTDLLGTGTPDAGYPDYTTLGTPYDEIWNTGGARNFPGVTALSLSDPYASAPTVGTIPSGETLVFIEKQDGSVYAADAITGKPYSSSVVTNGLLPGSGQSTGYTTVAPAPTVYDGYVYAGQPNGSLYVFSFVTSTANKGLTYQVGGSTEPIIAPPAVGIVRDDVSNTAVDDIVAAVTTNLGVYTVMLGARHDLVQYNANPSNMGYSPKQVGIGAGNYPSVDSTYPPSRLYSDNGSGYPAYVSGPPFMFPAAPPPPSFFADYNVDFSSTTGAVLNRATFNANPSTASNPTYTVKSAVISAPALASSGYFYYTATLAVAGGMDSTLVCAHDTRTSNAPQATNRLFWRFRLPFSGESPVDADGISYGPLQGFTFLGAPVVDSQNNVFALAVNNGQTAILCFNGTQAVSVLAVNPGQVTPSTVSIALITQPVVGSANDEFGNAAQALSQTLQYNGVPDGNGNVTIFNFGSTPSGASVYPNLSEPEPVTVAYTSNTSTGAATVVNPSAPMHTNMAWDALLPVAATSGLTLVGNYLFFGDANGTVHRLYAYPQEAGLVGPNRAVNVGTPANPTKDTSGRAIFAAVTTTAGAILGVPSAGNNVMIANGATGIVALGSRYTLVADSDRILEVDSDGLASWAVDSTSQPSSNGTVTHLDLNHPASVFQQAPNDYLVADTGNNRCVRFDRSGNVLWELTRFNDYVDANTTTLFKKSVPLLTPGEPTTLNHPTSVQTYKTYVPDSNGKVTATVVHYLISDTGNYRVLEIVDAYDASGNPIGAQHNLVWLSHTYDRQGRPYRYTSASYFTGPDGKHYVAALVTNARLAPPPAKTDPATGKLGPVGADAPGSSLVLLDYDPLNALGVAFASGSPETGFGANGQADGFISHAISTYYGYFQANGQFDINNAPKQPASGARTEPSSSATIRVQLFLRNPRFLQTYTPPGGTGALQNFLLADDNGVFDLFLNATNQFEAQWGFTQADYQSLLTPIDATLPSPGIPFRRNGLTYPNGPRQASPIAFQPSSLQRIGTEQVTDTAGTYLMGHYIVANGYSQGEVTPISGFGGEALELNDIAFSGNLVTQAYASFSKPSNTNPLSQPAFAVREK